MFHNNNDVYADLANAQRDRVWGALQNQSGGPHTNAFYRIIGFIVLMAVPITAYLIGG